MEPLTTTFTQSIPTLPTITSSRRLRSPQLSRSAAFRLSSRGLPLSYSLPKATTSEENSSTDPNRFFNEDRDSVSTLEQVESASNEESQMFEFLEKLNMKLDSEDGYSIILYGSGALVVLWLASALVGAIDSIPLFPKLMEVVGLGYTIWFSSRYLLFKKNREELTTKIKELKDQILGSDGD